MSDDRTPPAPPGAPIEDDPGTERDVELAALLAVPPLDDLTRRRMVGVAVRDRPRAARPVGRATAALGVAAALLLGVVVGAVVVTRPDDPQTTTAARAPEATDAAPKDAGAEAAAPALVPASDAANQLGDLGTVASPAALRAAITARLEAGELLPASALAGTCLARGPEPFGLVTITAVGTATLEDRGPVVVLVGPTPEGGDAAVAVTPTECTVLEDVPLRA